MAVRTATTQVFECDNVKCNTTRVAPEGSMPEGFSGHVTGHATGQTDSWEGEWWACSPRCIGPAVKNALNIVVVD